MPRGNIMTQNINALEEPTANLKAMLNIKKTIPRDFNKSMKRPLQSQDSEKTLSGLELLDDDARWKRTLETAIKSIVSIRFIVTRPFDTWSVGSYNATGFIVDVEKALILTNKHVVTDAPGIFRVCFKNSEEVPAWPVWRDPVHDFGILRFDKSKVNFMELISIPLAPQEARIGMEVRVPGADAGEKLAILSGIIARLDRPAANYGIGNYNDFNTFYFQASSNTSGGSSGSPVIDINGQAIALNAGGSVNAASSFFLPLPRIVRALNCIKKGKPVTRGTLQVEFIQKQYDEARRLGLPLSVESQFRELNGDLNGVLSVKHVIPNGPASNLLFTGDLLIKCQDELINEFAHLAEALDENVGENITLTVFRGGEYVDVNLLVGDLHSITPDRYVEIGGSIVHSLSYQLARSYLHPVGGVFVAEAGTMFGGAGVGSYTVVTAVNHVKTPDLDTFIEVMKKIPDGKRVPIRFYKLSKKNVDMIKIVMVEKRWSRFRMAVRDDSAGIWKYTDLNVPVVENLPMIPPFTSYIQVDPKLNELSRIAAKVLPSLTHVDYHAPLGIDGSNIKWGSGVGILLDMKKGLVAVDRSTIITSLGRVYCTFFNSAIIPGKIVYVHPLFNLAFIQLDKEQLFKHPKLPIQSLELSPYPKLQRGDEVFLVSIHPVTHMPRVQKTSVKDFGFFLFSDTNPPKFRTINFEDAITLQNPMQHAQGVIVDSLGRARGLWLVDNGSYIGIGLESGGMVREILTRLQSVENISQSPLIKTIDVELMETYLWKARDLGLSDEWICKIMNGTSGNSSNFSVVNHEEHVQQHHENINGTYISLLSSTAVTNNIPTPSFSSTSSSSPDGTSDADCANTAPAFTGSDRYSVPTVRRVPASNDVTDDSSNLTEGDLILSVNDKVVTRMKDIMSVVDAAECQHVENVNVIVLRDGHEKELTIPMKYLSGKVDVDVVMWAGAILQKPHKPIYFHIKKIPKGIYISLLYSGSPAQRDGLGACYFVTEVDGISTPTIESFLAVVEGPDWASKVPNVDPTASGWSGSSDSPSSSPSAPVPVSNLFSPYPTPCNEIDGITFGSKESGNHSDTETLTDIHTGNKTTLATSTRTFKLKLVSLEGIVKVVTVDVCDASKNYWPTWRCCIG